MRSTLPLPRVTVTKKLERSGLYDIGTPDGAVITMELPIIGGVAVENKSGHAYFRDEDNQFLNEFGYWVQVAGESCATPADIRVKRDKSIEAKRIDAVYRDRKARKKLEIYMNAGKGEFMNKILWLIAIPCATLLILTAMGKLGGGG